jgi:hypothetical protein
MANTTFTGPVVALNGFIGGPNSNAHSGADDTQQGGSVAYTVSNASNVIIASGQNSGQTVSAVGNAGVLLYVANGNSGSAIYAFSDGTTFLRVNDLSNISATA